MIVVVDFQQYLILQVIDHSLTNVMIQVVELFFLFPKRVNENIPNITPHYNLIESALAKQPLKSKFFGLFYESDFDGIRVIHVPLKKYKSTIIRILSFLYWHFISLIIGLSIKKVDFILSPSPPLSIGLISILIAKKSRAKFIYNVQEIYPDLLIKNGALKSNLIIKSLKWLEKYVYNQAAAVITIDQKFYDQIVDRFNEKDKLKIVPNFVSKI